jgi:hypothetical protein
LKISPSELRSRDPDLVLAAIKGVHTLIWLIVEVAMGWVLLSGVMKRSDRRAAVAGAVVAAESLVFLANGARCPLTALVESVCAEYGSVTDTYLPRWLNRSLPAIHVPLVAFAVYRHGRNLLDRREGHN